MITKFKDIRVKQKLTLLMMFVSCVTTVLAIGAILAYDVVSFQNELKDDLSTIAKIIAPNCAAAVEFNLPNEALETLHALKEAPNIISAAIYKDNQSIFADYHGAIDQTDPLTKPQKDGWHVSRNYIDLVIPITSHNARIGSLFLRSDFRKVHDQLKVHVFVMMIVLTACFLFALLIAAKFQRVISKPILHLAETAIEISKQNDYTLKAEKFGNDELGQFTDTFNSMIAHIHKQDEALRKYRDELENKVEERTVELLQSNTQLTREVSDRAQAEEALAAEKQRLSVTLRSIGDGVISTDREGMVLFLNNAAEELTGKNSNDAVGQPVLKILNLPVPEEVEKFENLIPEVLQTGTKVEVEGTLSMPSENRKDQRIVTSGSPTMGHDGNVIGVVIIFREITTREMLEQERLKSSKLESVGILAGGIAHDFNNILTAIHGSVSLAKRCIEDPEKIGRRLSTAEAATEKAQSLTQQLLTFAKGGSPILKPMSIRELIKESADFVLAGSNVRCQCDLPDDLWPINVDSGQMSQVINNLIINGQQAMPEGGIISVTAENRPFDHVTEMRHPFELSGNSIKITIIDQGYGISQQDISNIFDPYFTTKPKGSGLGLATTYSIIRNHEGYITVESELGEGTSFSIYLPALSKSVTVRDLEETQTISGSGKILVMDDEELVRDILTDILAELGYEFDISEEGEKAIELYKKALDSRSPYAAVILDLTIPGGMGGEETIKHLREIDPDVRSIVSSGYSSGPVTANYEKYGFSAVLPKPFNVTEMSVVLQSVLAKIEGA